MLIELGGYDVESGIGPWDPLNLATVTGDAMDVGARCELPLDPRVHRSLKAELTPCSRHALCRLRWYRQAEIKHGRVSMAAFVGWIVSQNGLSWPGIEKAWVGTRVDMWPKMPPQFSISVPCVRGLVRLSTLASRAPSVPELVQASLPRARQHWACAVCVPALGVPHVPRAVPGPHR